MTGNSHDVDSIADDVPVADAVEQAREVVEREVVETMSSDDPGPRSMETPDADWWEQSTDAGADLDADEERH